MIYGKEWTPAQIKKAALDVYRGLGKNVFDTVYSSSLSEAGFNRIVEHDSMDSFQEAYDRGKGVIAITSHVGCFELLLHLFAIRGFKCFAIGRKMFDAGLEQLIRNQRSGDNIDYIDRTEGALKAVRYLRKGRVFGVLIDQDTRVEGVFAPFLGKLAYTPSGPVKLAMKLGVPVFVVTAVRRPDNTHYIYISKELELVSTGDFDSDLVKNVGMVNDLICDRIRQFPSQWVWMHRRWRRKPPVDTGTRN